jgi:hypothetical protein
MSKFCEKHHESMGTMLNLAQHTIRRQMLKQKELTKS